MLYRLVRTELMALKNIFQMAVKSIKSNNNLNFIKLKKVVDKVSPSAVHRYCFEFTKGYIDKIKNCKILDIGCWVGNYQQTFVNAGKKIDMTGIDINEDVINQNKKNFPDMKFSVAPISKLPYKNNSFNIVTLWEVIEHIPKNTEEEAFAEIYRVMKRGGYLFVATPNYNIRSNLLDLVQLVFKGHRHYKERELIELIESSGLKVERIEYKGGFFEALYWMYFILLKHLLNINTHDTRLGMKIDKMIEKEYQKEKGFMEIWVVARKTMI